MLWLVAGLGNPGPRYADNRHNIGFAVLDALLQQAGGTFRTKFQAELAKISIDGNDVVLVKPMTYMNNSGVSVGQAAAFYKVAPANVLVVHDDIDLDFGRLKIKEGGGHGGHNGLRSIFSHFGRDFIRVRCGVGRPGMGAVSAHVLGNFDAVEKVQLGEFVDRAIDGLDITVRQGLAAAMNRLNSINKQGAAG
jgi:PTH1 family peptidyl-tRNA hydrolase